MTRSTVSFAVSPAAVIGRVIERSLDRLGVFFLLALGVTTAGATVLVGV